MAGSDSERTDRKVKAEALVRRAQQDEDELVELGDYRLQPGTGNYYEIGINGLLVQNTAAAVGHDLTVYADFQAGFAVIDLESGGEDGVE